VKVGRAAHGPVPGPERATLAEFRDLMLDAADVALKASWDPSIHIEEAVRAMTDLDHTLNLLGERLSSWLSRDAPVSDEPDAGSLRTAARRLVDESHDVASPLPGSDPALAVARKELARLYLETAATRDQLERAVTEALPRKAPNISSLLGPALAARMLAQAGGLARLARLPASTVQVLGAEKAFFEHLRGRAPPPRHGLLFLHPDIQGAPRRSRGKLARALAGKVAIAARMDGEGTALSPDLATAFRKRRDAIRSAPGAGPRAARSAPPLDGAPEHR
jgi:nucleolar protein 56